MPPASLTIPPFRNFEWRNALQKIKIPSSPAVTVAHVQTDYSAPWMAQFMLRQLRGQVVSREDAWNVVYVLPNQAAVDIASEFYGKDVTDNVTTLVRTYCDLIADCGSSKEYLERAIVIIDTNFGQTSATAVAAAAKLLDHWADKKVLGTAVALSPEEDLLWDDESIRARLSTEVTRVLLGPAAQYDLLPMSVPSMRNRDIIDAIVLAVEESRNRDWKSDMIFVACLAPQQLAHDLSQLNVPDMTGIPTKMVVMGTDNSRETLTKALQDETPANIVLVDPCLRFLPALPKPPSHVVLPCKWRVSWWDERSLMATEFERPCNIRFAALAAGLGQTVYRDDVTVIYATETAVGDSPRPRNLLPPAWGRYGAETMLCLVRILGERSSLADLCVAFPAHHLRTNEILESLVRGGLVRFVDGPPPWPRDARIKFADGFAREVFTNDLVESQLIAAMPDYPPQVKMTLGLIASILHVGIERIVQNKATFGGKTLQQLEKVCPRPWSRLMSKGRLWAVAGLVATRHLQMASQPEASDRIADTNLVIASPEFTALEQRFRAIGERTNITASHRTLASLPDDLKEQDELNIDMVLVKALIGTLSGVVDQPDGTLQLLGVATGLPIRYSSRCGWGDGLVTTDTLCMGLYVGLNRAGEEFRTDWLILVQPEAMVSVLESLFPGVPEEEWQRRLTSNYPW
ncbi:hypothetical protein VTJ49DRAFT_5975 [Mycothermus thermophilus]|uniref:Uncharacterized protein n=1 Tax=Humicola insolens TaxID=85995 RepID=A0ABR3V389_HUMIN